MDRLEEDVRSLVRKMHGTETCTSLFEGRGKKPKPIPQAQLTSPLAKSK